MRNEKTVFIYFYKTKQQRIFLYVMATVIVVNVCNIYKTTKRSTESWLSGTEEIQASAVVSVQIFTTVKEIGC